MVLKNQVLNKNLKNPKNLVIIAGMDTFIGGPRVLEIGRNCCKKLNNTGLKFSYVSDESLM